MAFAAAGHRVYCHLITCGHMGNAGPCLLYDSAELMSDDHGISGKGMDASGNLQIGAANPRRGDPDQHIVVMGDLRLGKIDDFQPVSFIYINCLHAFHLHR